MAEKIKKKTTDLCKNEQHINVNISLDDASRT